jgi:hypothetical protein
MKTHVLTGSRAEIVEKLSHIEGEVFEAIVHVVENPPVEPVQSTAPPAEEEDMFAEMRPLMVDIDLDEVDFSREAIYTRYPGE